MGRKMYHSPDNTPQIELSEAELPARQRALNLAARRDELEKQMREQEAILRANDSTMATHLIDSEGFPRADIDVYAVRYARVR